MMSDDIGTVSWTGMTNQNYGESVTAIVEIICVSPQSVIPMDLMI